MEKHASYDGEINSARGDFREAMKEAEPDMDEFIGVLAERSSGVRGLLEQIDDFVGVIGNLVRNKRDAVFPYNIHEKYDGLKIGLNELEDEIFQQGLLKHAMVI